MVRKTLLKVLVAGVVFGCVAKIIRDRVCGEDTFCFDEEYPDDDNGAEEKGAEEKDTEKTDEGPSLDDAPGKTISMPPSTERIGTYAFYGNNYIEYMELPEGLKEIGRSAFENCTKLNCVKMHEGLKEIGDYAFYGTAVTEVVIPNSVERIGEYTFAYCKNLRKVFMPKKFKNLPRGIFQACPNLEEIVFTER